MGRGTNSSTSCLFRHTEEVRMRGRKLNHGRRDFKFDSAFPFLSFWDSRSDGNVLGGPEVGRKIDGWMRFGSQTREVDPGYFRVGGARVLYRDN